MQHSSIVSLCTLALACSFFAGCQRSENKSAGVQLKSGGSSASTNLQTSFQNEAEFIVENVITDLAEQVFFAKRHKLPEAQFFTVKAQEKTNSTAELPTYEVRLRLDESLEPLVLELAIKGPIWSPAVYDPIVEAIAGALGLPRTSRDVKENADLIRNLTQGLATTIEKENRKLSTALEKDFTNSELHDQAALLLGAFALREHSGHFYDIRSPLNRATAHLALARYLRGEKTASVTGRLAEALLFSLMNNQVEALKRVEDLNDRVEGVTNWVRVLRAHNTSDYRPLAAVTSPKLLERIAWFRASAQSANDEISWANVEKERVKTPDFCRIAHEEGYSVETGHELMQLSLRLELAEIAAVYGLSNGQGLKSSALVAALNSSPERAFSTLGSNVRVRVIGWGQWAMFLQRHLCHALQHNFNMLKAKWGVEEDAMRFATEAEQNFGGLQMYPFVRRFTCMDATAYRRAVNDSLQILMKAPHWVSTECWITFRSKPSFTAPYLPIDDVPMDSWFKYTTPPGTAYDAWSRVRYPMLIKCPDTTARVTSLHQLAPNDRFLCALLLHARSSNAVTYAQALEVYGPILPFSNFAMKAVADTVQDDPKRFEEWMFKLASVDPTAYFRLGEYFQERKQDDKASLYYEKADAYEPDSIRRASVASWRVKYYLKKGRKDMAREVADFGAEVYSAAGLHAKAQYHEAVNEHAAAFEWYQKLEERYNDSGPLLQLCRRYQSKTGDRRFEPVMKKGLAGLFPKGVEKVSLSSFSSAPADGVLIGEENDLLREAGLRRGNVIVAVYGIRVHNFNQYRYAREESEKAEMNLIVWKNGKYEEVRCSPPNHQFGVRFVDYPQR